MKKCEKCSCEFDDSLAVCPDCGAKQTKKKKLGKKAFLIICTLICVVALAGLIVYNYVMNTLIPSQLYEQIDALIEEERFAEARGIARDVPLKISEELENYVINEAYARVQALISDGELKAARKALTDFKVFDEEAKNELAQLILEKCNHELVLMDRGIATCLEEGFELNGCPSCGYEEKITIEKLQHKYDYKETLAPTCEKEGQKEAVCSLCGTKDTKAIEATGHTWGESKVTKAPTCVEKGVSTETCTVCAKTRDAEVAATGVHKYGEKITKTATCSGKGEKTFTCTMCQRSYTESIPATGQHSLTNVTVSAVECSSYVDYQTKCTVCGAVTASWSEWVDHSWSEATCTEPPKCTKCGETEWYYYGALGHDWEWATCTTPDTCKRCGETSGEANGHDWIAATVEAPKTCDDCGITEGSAIAPVNIHVRTPLPATFVDEYKSSFTNNVYSQTIKLTNISVEQNYYSYSDCFIVYIYVYCELISTDWSYSHTSYIDYNLYDSIGNLVDSGTIDFDFYGTSITDDDYIYCYRTLTSGDYYLEFTLQ